MKWSLIQLTLILKIFEWFTILIHTLLLCYLVMNECVYQLTQLFAIEPWACLKLDQNRRRL